MAVAREPEACSRVIAVYKSDNDFGNISGVAIEVPVEYERTACVIARDAIVFVMCLVCCARNGNARKDNDEVLEVYLIADLVRARWRKVLNFRMKIQWVILVSAWRPHLLQDQR